MKEQSMLIKNEKVEMILEYVENKFVVSLYPTDILVTKDWKQVNVI